MDGRFATVRSISDRRLGFVVVQSPTQTGAPGEKIRFKAKVQRGSPSLAWTSTGLLKNGPIPTTPSHLVGIFSFAVPALVEIEPTGQHQVGLLGEAVSIGVGEDKFALVVEEDFQ